MSFSDKALLYAAMMSIATAYMALREHVFLLAFVHFMFAAFFLSMVARPSK